jgi:hypothetical protein
MLQRARKLLDIANIGRGAICRQLSELLFKIDQRTAPTLLHHPQ